MKNVFFLIVNVVLHDDNMIEHRLCEEIHFLFERNVKK